VEVEVDDRDALAGLEGEPVLALVVVDAAPLRLLAAFSRRTWARTAADTMPSKSRW
jgi:hypothetical protein